MIIRKDFIEREFLERFGKRREKIKNKLIPWKQD